MKILPVVAMIALFALISGLFVWIKVDVDTSVVVESVYAELKLKLQPTSPVETKTETPKRGQVTEVVVKETPKEALPIFETLSFRKEMVETSTFRRVKIDEEVNLADLGEQELEVTIPSEANAFFDEEIPSKVFSIKGVSSPVTVDPRDFDGEVGFYEVDQYGRILELEVNNFVIPPTGGEVLVVFYSPFGAEGGQKEFMVSFSTRFWGKLGEMIF